MRKRRLIPDPPPDKRFTFNTKFQRALCQQGFNWRTAIIADWVSRGANVKDVAKWMSLSVHTVTEHLSRAYALLGLGGKGSALLLVGVRLRMESLTKPQK